MNLSVKEKQTRGHRGQTLQLEDLSCVYYAVAVQLLSRVRLFATLWTAPRQASLSFTISRSLLRLMSIELVMPSNHLILMRCE